jgi:ABC-type multidrug transport system permease subunit
MSIMRTQLARVVFLIAANDFKMTVRSRGVILWIFAMPVVFMLAFGLAFREDSGGVRKARLTVENADTGLVARSLVDELRAEPFEIVDSLAAGEKAVRTLVIPADFTEKVLGRNRVTLILRKDEGANVQASEAASAAILRSLMRVVSRLIEVEADALDARTEGIALAGDSLAGSLLAATRIRPALLDSIEVDLDSLRAAPPLVTVSAVTAGRANKTPSGFQASVPGNLVMFVLMTMVFSGAVIAVERSTGVLKRYAYAPTGRTTVLLGKLLGRMLIAFVQIVFLLLIGKYAFRISLGDSPGALIVLMTVFAFCTGAFGVFFGSLFRNPEQVSAVSIVTTLAMAALGGCWWSIELVPRTFKIISLLFPTGWMMEGIHRIVSFGYGMNAIALHAAVLAGFGIAFVLLASWRLRLAD